MPVGQRETGVDSPSSAVGNRRAGAQGQKMVNEIRALSTSVGPADRLIALESEDRRLKLRMERDTKRRAEIREERLRLRCSLTDKDRIRYDALRAVEGAERG